MKLNNTPDGTIFDVHFKVKNGNFTIDTYVFNGKDIDSATVETDRDKVNEIATNLSNAIAPDNMQASTVNDNHISIEIPITNDTLPMLSKIGDRLQLDEDEKKDTSFSGSLKKAQQHIDSLVTTSAGTVTSNVIQLSTVRR